jgi:hypothetical protein
MRKEVLAGVGRGRLSIIAAGTLGETTEEVYPQPVRTQRVVGSDYSRT